MALMKESKLEQTYDTVAAFPLWKAAKKARAKMPPFPLFVKGGEGGFLVPFPRGPIIDPQGLTPNPGFMFFPILAW